MTVMVTATATAGERGNALVFGGTGRLGAPIVRLLVEAGHPVTVFVRPTSDRARLDGLEVDYIVGDLTDGASVATAVGGKTYTFVIDASSRGSNPDPFYADAMRNILAAVVDSDVQQFILHGSVGAGDNIETFPDVPFGRMTIVLAAKGEAETLLKASGMVYTIIRNGRVMSDGTPATKQATLSGDDTTMSKITRADLALLTLQCLANPDCFNKTYHAVDESL